METNLLCTTSATLAKSSFGLVIVGGFIGGRFAFIVAGFIVVLDDIIVGVVFLGVSQLTVMLLAHLGREDNIDDAHNYLGEGMINPRKQNINNKAYQSKDSANHDCGQTKKDVRSPVWNSIILHQEVVH